MKTTELTGVQKAALVLMQMDRQQASEVLRHFGEAEAETVVAEIVRLRQVDSETVEGVLAEVHGVLSSGLRPGHGGRDFAAGLLADTFGAEHAEEVMNRLAENMTRHSFEFLEVVDPQQISALLDHELPQTVALVLAHLSPEAGSSVLSDADSQRRTDVATCMATMGQPSPDAVAVVSDVLRSRLGGAAAAAGSRRAVGGVQPLVDIINRSDVTVERELLAELAERDQELAEEVKARLLTFADIVRFDARDVQLILRGIEATTLALALKGASTEVEDLIRANITERATEILDEELSTLGPVRLSQVEEARAEIVQQIRALESQEKITIARMEEDTLVL